MKCSDYSKPLFDENGNKREPKVKPNKVSFKRVGSLYILNVNFVATTSDFMGKVVA